MTRRTPPLVCKYGARRPGVRRVLHKPKEKAMPGLTMNEWVRLIRDIRRSC